MTWIELWPPPSYNVDTTRHFSLSCFDKLRLMWRENPIAMGFLACRKPSNGVMAAATCDREDFLIAGARVSDAQFMIDILEQAFDLKTEIHTSISISENADNRLIYTLRYI